MKLKQILCSLLCLAATSGAVAQDAVQAETEEQKESVWNGSIMPSWASSYIGVSMP